MHDSVFYSNYKLFNAHSKNKILIVIFIFIAIAIDESIFLDVLHFPMKSIKSCDLDATLMGGGDVKTSQLPCLFTYNT